jgi:NAD(P)-dependent dehydrogenase (short-subunit alcohol dehydrogenase family)
VRIIHQNYVETNDSKLMMWLITGTSSGLGAALACAVLANGDDVVGVQRDANRLDPMLRDHPRFSVEIADVTDPAAPANAVARALERAGRIDLLVNNAGTTMLAALEEQTDAEFRAVLETNLHAPIAFTRAVIPAMRTAGAGHIVNVSSIGGFSGMAGSTSYCASKFGLEGFSEALRDELAPFGIRVTIVEPGAFRTDFRARNMHHPATTNTAYDTTVQAARTRLYEQRSTQAGDPARAADAIIAAVQAERAPMRLLLGPDAWTIAHKKLADLATDFDAWETVTRGTDYEPA